jgi:hypothetical protein
MNAPDRALLASPPLAHIALRHLAPAAHTLESSPVAVWLGSLRDADPPPDLPATLQHWRQAPPAADAWLHRLATELDLADAECLAAALAAAVETDPMSARAVAWLQAPLPESRPTVGLIAALLGDPSAGSCLLDGTALATGLLALGAADIDRPLADTALRLPWPLVAAAGGGRGGWPGVRWLSVAADDDAPRAAAVDDGVLVLRAADRRAAEAAAAGIAARAGHRAVALEGPAPPGWVPWLLLHGAWPVLCLDAAPGERARLPAWPGWRGPVLVAAGLEGHVEAPGRVLVEQSLPMPDVERRRLRWRAQGLDADTAAQLGRERRLSLAGIDELAARARRLATGERQAPGAAHVAQAARHTRVDLGSLAQPLPDAVADDALVLAPALRAELARLLQRCRRRDTLAAGLGPAARTRYRPGVRALLVGASGTGKTLACGWLATRLGWPLVRVDMAAVSSKYIGETEKNLADLFARAEQAEVVLLFDEADALFGKRTEVRDAHDRYANQQTNYLLQRIEAFDGVALLTSNSRSRFDPAFTRRLDAIVEFPLPGADERRALWLAHLGAAHALDDGALNRLAMGCELAGGHVRNVVLAARAAGDEGAPVDWTALQDALAAEYRKLGKPLPAPLAAKLAATLAAGASAGR